MNFQFEREPLKLCDFVLSFTVLTVFLYRHWLLISPLCNSYIAKLATTNLNISHILLYVNGGMVFFFVCCYSRVCAVAVCCNQMISLSMTTTTTMCFLVDNKRANTIHIYILSEADASPHHRMPPLLSTTKSQVYLEFTVSLSLTLSIISNASIF